MIVIKEIKKRDFDLCFELDSKTISLWSKEQWNNEFEKEGVRVFGLSLSGLLIGVCVFQIVIDEAQINYFAVDYNFQGEGYGTTLMRYLIKECKRLEIKKLLLEVSETNFAAGYFYKKFDFLTVGIRKKYYKDGSNAFLKEKDLKIIEENYCADNQNA